MGLEEYKRKREFSKTPEPGPADRQTGQVLRFVVQKHSATRLHYDLRLELDGVLKSWAVPKGPTLDPSLKRLAMMVEDHPFDYRSFEGTIPKGNYGSGQVIVWDEGTYQAPHAADAAENEKLLRAGLAKGDLKFVLEGHKLRGEFALVRIKGDKGNSWLLIKKKDQWASTEDVLQDNRSVLSDLRLGDVRGAEALRMQEAPQTVLDIPLTPTGREKESPPLDSAPITSVEAPEAPSPMPHDIKPMLATLVEEPFDDPGWLFEIKQDGYRAIAEVDHGAVQLYSRNNLPFNRRFPTVVASLKSLPGQAVLDGELVALDEQGRSYFQLLQNNLRRGQGDILYYVFDLIFLDGRDLRNLPLSARKELLRSYLPELPDVRFCDHIAEFGRDFFELARARNLEGVVAKRADSLYQTGRRSRDWLKIKIRLEQEAVICGFTAPRGGRKLFGSLVLGAYQDGELQHIGYSGGGFDERMLRELHAKLEPLILPDPPFAAKVKADMPITWVRPVLVCEVSFGEWTDEKVMRQPVFLGFREDKEAASVHLELPELMDSGTPPSPPQSPSPAASAAPGTSSKELEVLIDGHRIKLSNLDKMFWPVEGYRKGDVIDYYRTMAPVLLPHLKDRPESLYRTPNGITEKGFFQKEAGVLPPDWMLTREIFSESNQKNIRFFICQDEATLVYLANLGCIEINPWLSRLQHLENPDYFVIDLDPEDIAFEKVVDAALEVRRVLEQAQAVSFPKTSGATGIHIYVPLGARYDYDAAVKFAQVVATLVQRQIPDFTSILRDPRKRQQRVYLDFLQNRGGQTLAAPYSIRPRPGATVSTPLAWQEVRHGLSPQQFTIKTVPERVARLGDLFQGVLGPGIDLEQCLENLLTPYR